GNPCATTNSAAAAGPVRTDSLCSSPRPPTSVAGGQHGGNETEQVRMQEQRIVPDRLLKEEVTRAGLPNRYAGRHPDRHASGSIQERTALGLDPVVRLDSDSEIEDAARAIGRDARDGRSVGSETIGCLVDPLSLRAIESHLQRVRPRIAREGGAHFSGRLILEGAERLRAVVRSGQADPGADALGTELGRVP